MSKPHRNKQSSHTYKGHFHLPKALLENSDFAHLSGKATKLLVDIGSQFNGYNNGDLCIALKLMKARGWNSNDSLNKAKQELLERDLITLTKQGGLGMGPNLYAITWQPIHECGGKLDVASTTIAPRKLCEN
jgi:hypothetical protein